MRDERWQLCYVDCRGLALNLVGVGVCIERKGEGFEARAGTITREGSLDVAPLDDASAGCRVACESFKGV